MINAEVDHISLVDHPILPAGAVNEGFFFTRLVVIRDKKIVHDLDLTVAPDGSGAKGYNDGDGPISGTYVSNQYQLPETIQLEVRHYENPQVLNEILIHVPSTYIFDGLMFQNYRHKYFSLYNLNDQTIKRVPQHTQRVTTEKGIINKGEITDSVLHTRLHQIMFE